MLKYDRGTVMIYWIDIGTCLGNMRCKPKELHSIIGKGILNYYLCSVGYTVADLAYTKNGKPYFLGLEKYCSVSHSHNIVAVGISKQCIGVDVQYQKKINIAVMNRYFCSSEQNYVGNHLKHFYQIWCGKEALVKYLGIRLAEVIKDIEVTIRGHHFAAVYKGKRYPLTEVNLQDDYEMMICHRDVDVKCRRLEIEDIIDYCEFKERIA